MVSTVHRHPLTDLSTRPNPPYFGPVLRSTSLRMRPSIHRGVRPLSATVTLKATTKPPTNLARYGTYRTRESKLPAGSVRSLKLRSLLGRRGAGLNGEQERRGRGDRMKFFAHLWLLAAQEHASGYKLRSPSISRSKRFRRTTVDRTARLIYLPRRLVPEALHKTDRRAHGQRPLLLRPPPLLLLLPWLLLAAQVSFRSCTLEAGGVLVPSGDTSVVHKASTHSSRTRQKKWSRDGMNAVVHHSTTPPNIGGLRPHPIDTICSLSDRLRYITQRRQTVFCQIQGSKQAKGIENSGRQRLQAVLVATFRKRGEKVENTVVRSRRD